MSPVLRLIRFGAVGVVSTAVHALVLALLSGLLHWPVSPANLLAFVVAFLVSVTAQQRYTFSDRLQGSSLRHRSVLLLFGVNALAAYLAGLLARGGALAFLPLLPALINYLLLHGFSGDPRHRR